MILTQYEPHLGPELVQMWRDSFERGVGIKDRHPIDEQLRFLNEELTKSHSIVVVRDKDTTRVVAFLAATADKISQLYVHVDHQNEGIGSMLLNLAKENSNGRLRLFTFDRNKGAQRFYEKHGFRIVARGFEEGWQLADIEYEWVAGND